MPRRAHKWIIENDGSAWHLKKGGRYLYQGLGSQQEAVKRLRNYHRPGEPVILEEQDGYQTNITDQLRRRGLIS